MSQRNSGYLRREADLYETPAWVTHALCAQFGVAGQRVWEPACASGQMASVLSGSKASVRRTDISIDPSQDFLALNDALDCNIIITNPPYELAREFCEHALGLMQPARGAVAMLLRTDFDNAVSRAHLFGGCPAFSKKLVLTKRIAWFVEADGKPKASPSFNHAWYIWDWKHQGPPTISYGPTRCKLNQNVNLPKPSKSPNGTVSHADLFAHPRPAPASAEATPAVSRAKISHGPRKPRIVRASAPFFGGQA